MPKVTVTKTYVHHHKHQYMVPTLVRVILSRIATCIIQYQPQTGHFPFILNYQRFSQYKQLIKLWINMLALKILHNFNLKLFRHRNKQTCNSARSSIWQYSLGFTVLKSISGWWFIEDSHWKLAEHTGYSVKSQLWIRRAGIKADSFSWHS